jgi:squalene-hopene/tetraprenyl-beta-curcumene cyclase
MSVSSASAGRPAHAESVPSHPGVPGFDEAITRSQSYLLSEQRPEGYWIGELLVDVTLVADMVAFYHWWGKVNREWERKAIHHIFSKHLTMSSRFWHS